MCHARRGEHEFQFHKVRLRLELFGIPSVRFGSFNSIKYD